MCRKIGLKTLREGVINSNKEIGQAKYAYERYENAVQQRSCLLGKCAQKDSEID